MSWIFAATPVSTLSTLRAALRRRVPIQPRTREGAEAVLFAAMTMCGPA
jgi:hypothetical protein